MWFLCFQEQILKLEKSEKERQVQTARLNDKVFVDLTLKGVKKEKEQPVRVPDPKQHEPASDIPIPVGPAIQLSVNNSGPDQPVRAVGAVQGIIVGDQDGHKAAGVGEVNGAAKRSAAPTAGGAAKRRADSATVGEMDRSASAETEWPKTTEIVGVRRISAKPSERAMKATIYKNIEDGSALCDGEKLTEVLREKMKERLSVIKEDLRKTKKKTEEEIAVLKGVWMRCEGIITLWKGTHTLPL